MSKQLSDITRELFLETRVIFYMGRVHSKFMSIRESFESLLNKNEILWRKDPIPAEHSDECAYLVTGGDADSIYELIPTVTDDVMLYDINRKVMILACGIQGEHFYSIHWSEHEGLFRRFALQKN